MLFPPIRGLRVENSRAELMLASSMTGSRSGLIEHFSLPTALQQDKQLSSCVCCVWIFGLPWIAIEFCSCELSGFAPNSHGPPDLMLPVCRRPQGYYPPRMWVSCSRCCNRLHQVNCKKWEHSRDKGFKRSPTYNNKSMQEHRIV